MRNRLRLGVWLGLCALSLGGVAGADELLVRRFDFDEARLDRHLVPGAPAIPRFTWRILLPHGTELAAADFLAEPSRAAGPAYFPATPFPRSLCGGGRGEETPPLRFDAGQSFPAKHWGGAETLVKHGYRVVEVTIFPLRYFPATGEAAAIAGGELRLRLRQAAPAATYRGLPDDRAEVLLLADDSDAIVTYPPATARASVDYLVIAPQSLLDESGENSLRALLDEKESRLLTTATLSLETVARESAGRDVPEKIRNAIVGRYAQGLRFVLLVGNGYSILPTRKLTVRLSEGTLPSDLYFACLDGDFDGNHNGTFGETNDGPGGGDVDLACEIAVGRAPVSNAAELRAFVEKTVKLQQLTPADPRVRNTLLFGEKLDDRTLGSKALRQLVEGGKAGGMPTLGYPTKVSATELAETFSKQYSGNEAIASLNGGEFYTVNHLGHANQNYCMRFNASAIPQLRNDFPFFGITQGCHPGDLRGPNWASKLVVSAEGGAAAMIANSNYGYYSPGGVDGVSNRLHLVFWDTVFNEFHRYVGRAHFRAKERLIPQVKSDPYLRWVVYETNLLGDPELVLKF